MVRTAALAASTVALALMGTACSTPTGDATSSEGITVAAAASLTDVFATIGAQFTESSGIPVTFSFAGSSAIAEQVRGGAPIDVFASAGTVSMEPLVSEQLVIGVADFATNSLVIAVPTTNPGGVATLDDLSRVSLVVCEEEVPCGAATAKLLAQNAVTVTPVSYEPDVRSVLTKVSTDEVDAGLVYVTDAAAAQGSVTAITIPPQDNVITTYQAAVVSESRRRDAAGAFVAFLSGPRAQETLAAAGFGATP